MKFKLDVAKRRFNVLTPDGGVIECKHEAAARRVHAILNELCAVLCNNVPESEDMTRMLDNWSSKHGNNDI